MYQHRRRKKRQHQWRQPALISWRGCKLSIASGVKSVAAAKGIGGSEKRRQCGNRRKLAAAYRKRQPRKIRVSSVSALKKRSSAQRCKSQWRRNIGVAA